MADHEAPDVWVVVAHGGDGYASEVEGVFASEREAIEAAEALEIDGVVVVDVEIVGRRIGQRSSGEL
jgi:hypothetical protein